MRMITMLILSLGIGIYVFGISQQIGYTQEVLHWKRDLFLGVSFGLMEMLMLLFGVGLSVWIPTQRWLQEVVIIALILIGADMFRRAVWGKAPEERREEPGQPAASVRDRSVSGNQDGIDRFLFCLGGT